ncbi:MAG: hypothetical protein SO287_07545 [Parabacteroides sp.]|nr:hypothetical protein [Parabacteroides sp.]
MNAKKMLFAGVCLLAACFTQAQESQMPKAFSYQAVVRDNAGKVVADKEVGVKIEILKGSAESGTVVYEETLRPKSTMTGTVNMMIGNGNTEQFAAIDWGGNAHFLRISLSLDGSDNYKVVSTTQMLPVPYALYAEKAGSVVDNGSGGSTEPDTPSDGTLKYGRDFIIAPVDGMDADKLFKILAGEYDEGPEYIHYIEFALIYLTDSNLELTAEISGYTEDESMCSPSSVCGRNYRFQADVNSWGNKTSAGEYSTKIIVKDKDSNTIKEFPFIIKYTYSPYVDTSNE